MPLNKLKSYADEAFERHLVAVLFYAKHELSPAQRAVLVTELQKAVSEMDAEDAAAEAPSAEATG